MSFSPRPRPLAVAAALLSLLACDGGHPPAAPGAERGDARLTVRASIAGTAIQGISAEVTARDIAVPVVGNLVVGLGRAAGAITVPAGSDRTITLRAFDAGGIETHRGSVTLSVRPGENPPVAVTLQPLPAGTPVGSVIPAAAIAVTPDQLTLAPGGSAQLQASVTDESGRPIAGGAVQWATLDPRVAVVSARGLVIAAGPGQTRVLALAGGVTAAATVTVR